MPCSKHVSVTRLAKRYCPAQPLPAAAWPDENPTTLPCSTPALFSFFQPAAAWPDDALASVAQQALRELPLDAGLRGALAEQCVEFHITARKLTER